MSELPPVGLAVVGYGYWGPNLVRNAVARPEFEVKLVCDLRRERLAMVGARHSGVATCATFDAVLRDPKVDAVAIATPPSSHYTLVRQALEAGKHVLVEKPLAMSSPEAVDLIAIATERELVVMPAHTFLYSPPVSKVEALVEAGELGDLYFVTSSRMNLGICQPDGVIWDLAPHDLAILHAWIDQPLAQVAATGQSAFRNGVCETAFLSLTFAGGVTANVQLSWLAPRKTRQMVVVGSKRMVIYDDAAADEIVRVYDRGVELSEPANFGEYKLTYRSGDMVAPRIDAVEPLSLELQDFARAIRTGSTPRSSAQIGLDIVRAIEAAEASLKLDGVPVRLGPTGHASIGSDAETLPTYATPAGRPNGALPARGGGRPLGRAPSQDGDGPGRGGMK